MVAINKKKQAGNHDNRKNSGVDNCLQTTNENVVSVSNLIDVVQFFHNAEKPFGTGKQSKHRSEGNDGEITLCIGFVNKGIDGILKTGR